MDKHGFPPGGPNKEEPSVVMFTHAWAFLIEDERSDFDRRDLSTARRRELRRQRRWKETRCMLTHPLIDRRGVWAWRGPFDPSEAALYQRSVGERVQDFSSRLAAPDSFRHEAKPVRME